MEEWRVEEEGGRGRGDNGREWEGGGWMKARGKEREGFKQNYN